VQKTLYIRSSGESVKDPGLRPCDWFGERYSGRVYVPVLTYVGKVDDTRYSRYLYLLTTTGVGLIIFLHAFIHSNPPFK
jgi:hypothetical protein